MGKTFRTDNNKKKTAKTSTCNDILKIRGSTGIPLTICQYFRLPNLLSKSITKATITIYIINMK